MRLTAFFFLVTALHVSAKTFSQKVTISAKNQPLRQVLRTISDQTGYEFIVNPDLLKGVKPVTLEVREQPLSGTLDALLKDRGFAWAIKYNTIVVTRVLAVTGAALTDSADMPPPPVTVTGVVRDDKGEPLANVTVGVKGIAVRTLTDTNGVFAIQVPDAQSVLIFSYVGYQTYELALGGRNHLTIALSAVVNPLDQVIVVGYGTQQKKDVTGSVAVVKSEKVANIAVPDIGSAIQGKVAGVQVTNNGAPGTTPQIRIRGVGSVTSGVNPLFVVDGVMVDDISYIGPADIESVSVLKDASSAAIYGVRAANGVILITTKKGKKGDKVNAWFNAYVGHKQAAHATPLATGQQYVTLYNEKMDLLGQSGSKINYSDYNTSTNWMDEVLTGSTVQNYDLGFQGGSKNTSYNVGANYLSNKGLIRNNPYERISLKTNYDFDVSKYVKSGVSLVISSIKGRPYPGNVLNEAYRALPVVKPRVNDTTFTDPNQYNLTGQAVNPAATLYYNHHWQNQLNAVGNAYIDIRPVSWLSLKSNLGINRNSNEEVEYDPEYHVSDFQANASNKMDKVRNSATNIYWDNTATFDKTFAAVHHVKFLAGYSYQLQKTDYLTAAVSGLQDLPAISQSFLYLDMPRIDDLYAASITDDGSRTVAISYLSRLNYDYDNKYLLTLTWRADGSSKFPASSRWGYFPSVGLGWNMTEEAFMKNIRAVNYLKLRGSWGKLGNNNIPSNIYSSTVNTGAYTAVVFGPDQNSGNGTVSYSGTIDQLFNPNLKWEVVEEYDGGVDATFLNNRFTVTLDYYTRNTTNAIFPLTDIGSSGLSATGVWGNYANINNKGVELSLGWRETRHDWVYSLNANLTANRNKLTRINKEGKKGLYAGYDDTQNFTYSTVGQAIGEFYGYKVIGVFQNQSDIDKNPHIDGTVPGDLKFADVNKDGVLDASDRTSIGNPNPTFQYGFDATVGYKGFDLMASVQGVTGNDLFNVNRMYRFGNENWDQDFYKHRWHGEGTSNKYPSALMSNPTTPSSFYVEKGDYLRIKTLQLGYSLPAAVLRNLNVTKVRFYVNLENPFTFFKYNGFSPEASTDNPLLAGVDRNVYPLSKLYTMGVNLNF